MKEQRNLLLILTALLTVVVINACSNGNNAGGGKSSGIVIASDTAVISFREYEHDFGEIAEGEKVACVFTFDNTGKGPLVITSVTTSCGCTVPKYETKPVASGNSGIIEVVFDSSDKNGRQTKTVTVRSNASKPVVLLKISGEVITSTNN